MECQSPKYLHKQDIVVPCGNCAFCGATKRSDWSTRLHYESKLHLVKRFVTLTYADSHLVWKNGISQLHKRHLQLFFKRVRKAGYVVRYYAVGEYGSKTYRPHYHALLFGDIPEEAIRKAWWYGQVHIGQVTEASIMYCLGYMVNGKGYQMQIKRERPFALMSKGNGIPGHKFQYGLGSNYLSPEMIKWQRSEYKNYVIVDGMKRHLPRYYKTKVFSKREISMILSKRSMNETFAKMVAWVRSPAMRRHQDPLAYREEQIKRLAQKIRAKSKENLII